MKLVKEERVNERIHLKFEDFESICPFTRQSDKGDIELNYTPGRRQIDRIRLQNYLASFKTTEIEMEAIPIEVLKYCIKDCVNQPPPTREASPMEMEVRAVFPKGSKKGWGIAVNVNFGRQII